MPEKALLPNFQTSGLTFKVESQNICSYVTFECVEQIARRREMLVVHAVDQSHRTTILEHETFCGARTIHSPFQIVK